MKAITLWQPWSSLVAIGVKTVETRGRGTTYRGPLAIHAAKRPPRFEDRKIGAYYARGFGTASYALEGPGLPQYRSTPRLEGYLVPFGAIVASCTLVDVLPMVLFDDAAHEHLDFVDLVHDGYDLLELTRFKDRMSVEDLTPQIPYGDYRPGRYAWILEDIRPTTERCPACMDRPPRAAPGVCIDIDGGWWHEPGSCPYCAGACPTCRGGTRRVDPVPARGMQACPWEWTP